MTPLILGALLLQTQIKNEIVAPPPPLGSNAAFQSGSKAAAELLQAGKFAEATNQTKNLPSKQVVVEFRFQDVSKDSQDILLKAAQRAMNEWQKALPGSKIIAGKNPNLVLEVVSHFSDLGSTDEKSLSLFPSIDPADPALEAVLALKRTSKKVEISADNMTTEVRYVIGRYFGLEQSPDPSSAMFRVEGLSRLYSPLDAVSIQVARTTLQQAEQLRSWAKSKTRVKAEFGEAFLPQHTVDLGTVTQGDPQAFQFEVRNRGKGPLKFAVRPDCSCFLINYESVVKGGEVGIVTVQMSTVDFQGAQDKGLYVYTDDAENPVTRVSIKTMIRPAYRLIPESNHSQTYLMKPEGLTINYLLFADNELPLEPRKASVSGVNGIASISQWEGEIEDPEWFKGKQFRKGYRISVLFSPSAAIGRNLVALIIQTDSKMFPVLGSNFFIQKGIAVNPKSIFYGDVTSELERATVYLDVPSESTEILKATSSDSRFKASYERVSELQYRVTVDFRKGTDNGTVYASINLSTNDPDSPEIIIPLQAYVP